MNVCDRCGCLADPVIHDRWHERQDEQLSELLGFYR